MLICACNSPFGYKRVQAKCYLFVLTTYLFNPLYHELSSTPIQLLLKCFLEPLTMLSVEPSLNPQKQS